MSSNPSRKPVEFRRFYFDELVKQKAHQPKLLLPSAKYITSIQTDQYCKESFNKSSLYLLYRKEIVVSSNPSREPVDCFGSNIGDWVQKKKKSLIFFIPLQNFTSIQTLKSAKYISLYNDASLGGRSR